MRKNKPESNISRITRTANQRALQLLFSVNNTKYPWKYNQGYNVQKPLMYQKKIDRNNCSWLLFLLLFLKNLLITARTRNSIATCSTDHLRQGNKRPHSIISVSSNSSSNSSHSGFNAMNLAFNPVDSPRTYRRSLTFMSTGNGIKPFSVVCYFL